MSTMQQIRKVPRINNLTIKIISLVFGYLLWLTFSRQQETSIELNVPIYYTNAPENADITIAPEMIKVSVSGTKYDIARSLMRTSNAVHLDLSMHTESGNHEIEIYPDDIFLLSNVNLINYYPSKINVTIVQQ